MKHLPIKKIFLSIWISCVVFTVFAQIPNGYYNGTENLTGTQLQEKLHTIIDNHTDLSYSQLWDAFYSTDKKSNGKVWDMYSDSPNGTPPYTFTFGNDQCGSYSQEGDCYNREHTFPQSWFNEQSPMKSDLFHIYPTDGYVNNKRSSYPMGDVASASWTSQNGSKLGNCSNAGYSGTVFEPIDEYKGDFARTFFYMAVRYYNEDSGWDNTDMTNGSQLKSWAMTAMQQWHLDDPVSEKELARNEAVFALQGNRNPFIDCPSFVGKIWSGQASQHPIYDDCFPAPETCDAPENVSATKHENSITISWTSVPNAISYIIYKNGAILDEETSTEYHDNNLSDGTYCYTISTVCDSGNSDPSDELCETIVGLDEIAFVTEIFPNPVQTFFHLTVSENCEITLFNIVGEQVNNQQIRKETTEIIHVENLPNGIYILQIRSLETGYVNSYKIVK